MESSQYPKRSRPAHLEGVEKGFRSCLYFVTVCTHNRRRILANEPCHALLREAWSLASDFRVGRYVIMPDHVHLFCTPGIMPRATSLSRWVAFWKSWSASRWPQETGKVWQREFWDRQLRTGDSYSAKWLYVRENPVRAGLATHADTWPYGGELNEFSWYE